jgi:nitrate/nitrite transport system substrate-binding protein
MDQAGQDHQLKQGCSCCSPGTISCAEAAISSGLDHALISGLFPEPVLRRSLLKSVGAATLLGA